MTPGPSLPACVLCGEPTVPGGYVEFEGQPAHALCSVLYPRRLRLLPAVAALCDGIAAACGGATP